MDKHPVLLFDGVCNLCNGAVQFIIERDPKGVFRFASLQSAAAKNLLEPYPEAPEDISTIVLLENSRMYTRSDAALRAARHLPGAWPALYGFLIVPRSIRDAVYNWIARNRYRWFGKKDQCMIPTPELRDRFLD
ncbi:MAG: thiol-disulfide oxidoreductase DCC family protein [Phaeodactylibacter sp.]|nr:thiol-disulfide oxidoreductase DCC family protein [Phaeodactylibacter sp.]MCB9054085.1 thiol-disulfide oxidoreductase DCC family protein [Lewinellaceae bacterium]